MSILSSLLRDVAALFFPPRCPVCGRMLAQGEHTVCTLCRATAPLTGFWRQADNPVLGRCRDMLPVERASGLLYYVHGSGWRELIRGFKYRGAWRTARAMGEWYGRCLKESGLYDDVEVVVPLPLHPVKRCRRGYNQSEYIAEGIAAQLGVEVKGKRIVLLGGGGAASAIAIQAALEGAAEIAVFNLKDAFWPRVEKGLRAIAQAAPGCAITLNDLQDREALHQAILRCDILSNATRVGMAPYEDQSNITDLSWFRPDLIVTDVVYAPPQTRMLREAQAAGCLTRDGLGMLLCQGAEAFRLYSGLEMPVEEIRALLYA